MSENKNIIIIVIIILLMIILGVIGLEIISARLIDKSMAGLPIKIKEEYSYAQGYKDAIFDLTKGGYDVYDEKKGAALTEEQKKLIEEFNKKFNAMLRLVK